MHVQLSEHPSVTDGFLSIAGGSEAFEERSQ